MKQIVIYRGGIAVEKPAKPTPLATWDYSTASWKVPNAAETEAIFEGASYQVYGVEFNHNQETKTITWTEGLATRTNGMMSQTKTVGASSFTWETGYGPVFYYFNFASGWVHQTNSLETLFSSFQHILMFEYDGIMFKDAVNGSIVDGQRVLSRSIGANHLVANEAIIKTAHITDLSVERFKIANGAVTEQGMATVYQPGGGRFVMSTVSDNPNSQSGSFAEAASFAVGTGANAVSRIFLTPRLFGSVETTVINEPKVNGHFHAFFLIRFIITRARYDAASGTFYDEFQITEGSIKSHSYSWVDQYLTKAQGLDSSAMLDNSFGLNINEHYSDGHYIRVKLLYTSYSSNPSVCSITRSTPAFGFTYQAYWK